MEMMTTTLSPQGQKRTIGASMSSMPVQCSREQSRYDSGAHLSLVWVFCVCVCVCVCV